MLGCGHSGARAFAREPGIQEHRLQKSWAWPMFMGSGPGPEGPSRNDSRVFPPPAGAGLIRAPSPRSCLRPSGRWVGPVAAAGHPPEGRCSDGSARGIASRGTIRAGLSTALHGTALATERFRVYISIMREAQRKKKCLKNRFLSLAL
jgi:hypothetical protein